MLCSRSAGEWFIVTNIIDCSRKATALGCSLLLAGCAEDLMRFDGFGGPLALGPFQSYVQRLPIENVAAQLQCELANFLHKGVNNSSVHLNPRKAASVSLSLQTDITGNVTYTGIDLKKFGLVDAGGLIAVTNKLPSLQAKIAPKSTVSAQLDFNIPQAYHSPSYSHADVIKLKDTAKIKGLMGGPPCPTGLSAALNFPIEGLYLQQWLENFFKNIDTIEQKPIDVLSKTCMTKLTLKTQFQLLFDFSGGANIGALPGFYILPVSGLNFDASPAFTHTIQIALALEPNNNLGICKDDQQPNRQIPTVAANPHA